LLVRLHVDTRLIWPSVPNLSDCTSATTTGCVLLQPNFMSMWKDVVFHLIDKMCKEYLNEWMSTLIKIWSYDKDYNAYNQKNLVVNTFKLTDYEILLMKLTTYLFKPFMQYLYMSLTNPLYDSIKELNTFKTRTKSANNFPPWNGVLVAQ